MRRRLSVNTPSVTRCWSQKTTKKLTAGSQDPSWIWTYLTRSTAEVASRLKNYLCRKNSLRFHQVTWTIDKCHTSLHRTKTGENWRSRTLKRESCLYRRQKRKIQPETSSIYSRILTGRYHQCFQWGNRACLALYQGSWFSKFRIKTNRSKIGNWRSRRQKICYFLWKRCPFLKWRGWHCMQILLSSS